jgi:hypothetical protein
VANESNLPAVGQCGATNRQGERCKKPVVYGAKVCRIHGGNAPHVMAAAARRLVASSAPRAAEVLNELLEPTPKDASPCPLCGRDMPRDEALRHRVAVAILDRSGVGPTAKIEIDANVQVDYVRFLPREQLEQINEWLEMAKLKAAEELDESAFEQ